MHHGQNVKEFEGVVSYRHEVIPLTENYDIKRDLEYMGISSDFYYKEGKYKWLLYEGFMEMDMFRNKDSVDFLKMKGTDTIALAFNNVMTDTIINFRIIPNGDTVAGYLCNVLIVEAHGNGNFWTRTYSFTSAFSINGAWFKNYKYNATNFIYSKLNALPLKIEIKYKDRKVIYKAVKVKREYIPDSYFEFPPNTKFIGPF